MKILKSITYSLLLISIFLIIVCNYGYADSSVLVPDLGENKAPVIIGGNSNIVNTPVTNTPVIKSNNININPSIPSTGQNDVFVVGGLVVVIVIIAGYTYYKIKQSEM